MKKTLPIIAIVSSALVISASALAFSLQSNLGARANGTLEPYEIIVDSSWVKVAPSYDSGYGYYRFQLKGLTPRDELPFESDPNYTYFSDYNGEGYSCGADGFILSLKNRTFVGNFMYIKFPFSGPSENVSARAIIHKGGNTDPTTVYLTYDESGGVPGYLLSYTVTYGQEDKLEKIIFEYNC